MAKLQERLREILTNAPPEPYTRKGEEMYHTLTKAADALDALQVALEEARDALNGAPNTVGLHNQIARALAKLEGGK